MYILKQRKCRLKDLLVSFTPPFQEKVASLDIKNTWQTKPRYELHSHAKNCCLQNASKKSHFVVWYFQVPYATYVACISANHLHEYKYVFTTSLIIGGVWFLTNILLSKSAIMSTNLFSWVWMQVNVRKRQYEYHISLLLVCNVSTSCITMKGTVF